METRGAISVEFPPNTLNPPRIGSAELLAEVSICRALAALNALNQRQLLFRASAIFVFTPYAKGSPK